MTLLEWNNMEENMSLGLQTNFGILEMQSHESYQKSKHQKSPFLLWRRGEIFLCREEFFKENLEAYLCKLS